MTTAPQQDPPLGDKRFAVNRAIVELVDALGSAPGAVRDLSDGELLIVAAWGEHGAPLIAPWGLPYEPPRGVAVVTAECERRARQAHTFSAYLPQPTVGDLLRRVLDES